MKRLYGNGETLTITDTQFLEATFPKLYDGGHGLVLFPMVFKNHHGQAVLPFCLRTYADQPDDEAYVIKQRGDRYFRSVLATIGVTVNDSIFNAIIAIESGQLDGTLNSDQVTLMASDIQQQAVASAQLIDMSEIAETSLATKFDGQTPQMIAGTIKQEIIANFTQGRRTREFSIMLSGAGDLSNLVRKARGRLSSEDTLRTILNKQPSEYTKDEYARLYETLRDTDPTQPVGEKRVYAAAVALARIFHRMDSIFVENSQTLELILQNRDIISLGARLGFFESSKNLAAIHQAAINLQK